jgi:hypothetical protein
LPPTNDQSSSSRPPASIVARAFATAGLELQPVAHDGPVAEQALNVARLEPRHPLNVEARERAAVALALVQDRRPREPGLSALEHEQLEQVPLVVGRNAPLLVVVDHIQGVVLGDPGAPHRHARILTDARGAARRRPLART